MHVIKYSSIRIRCDMEVKSCVKSQILLKMCEIICLRSNPLEDSISAFKSLKWEIGKIVLFFLSNHYRENYIFNKENAVLL